MILLRQMRHDVSESRHGIQVFKCPQGKQAICSSFEQHCKQRLRDSESFRKSPGSLPLDVRCSAIRPSDSPDKYCLIRLIAALGRIMFSLLPLIILTCF